MIKAREINYQEEIEKLLKIPKLKEFSQLQHMQYLKEFDYKLYYEYLVTKQKELERQKELESQSPPPGDCKATHADHTNELLFIHNARQWQLLKERHKNSVLIDKMLVIISHEFLCYERNTIEMKLDKLLEYLNITVSKSSIDYIRRKLKSLTDFLIEKQFIQEMAIKNSVAIITLDTLYTKELETQRIITRIKRNDISLEDNLYIIKRVESFYMNNLKIKFTDIRIESIYAYIQDTNISRKKRKILDNSKKLN